MAVKQISVFLENKPGRLAELTKVLSDNKVNLRALSLAEAEDFGIVRLIVDDVFNTTTVLKDAGYVSSMKDVIAVELSDEPGALSAVLDILGGAGVNLDYMYGFTSQKAGKANMILRVSDVKKAAELLGANGISRITQDDLSKF